jgi:hypothetical protein
MSPPSFATGARRVTQASLDTRRHPSLERLAGLLPRPAARMLVIHSSWVQPPRRPARPPASSPPLLALFCSRPDTLAPNICRLERRPDVASLLTHAAPHCGRAQSSHSPTRPSGCLGRSAFGCLSGPLRGFPVQRPPLASSRLSRSLLRPEGSPTPSLGTCQGQVSAWGPPPAFPCTARPSCRRDARLQLRQRG